MDTQQINLTRFNLRFPEKRRFFLENSALFTVGKEEEIDLFFSRRIGLDENGLLVPINAGARLTGKVNGINVGVLNMQTDPSTPLRAGPSTPLRAGPSALLRINSSRYPEGFKIPGFRVALA